MIKTLETYVNNQKDIEVDFSIDAGKSSTTVSSVAWAVEEGSSVTLGTPVLASGVATVPIITTDSTGCSLVRAKATFADGQIISQYRKINVIDPSC